jgi:hypothetical protein
MKKSFYRIFEKKKIKNKKNKKKYFFPAKKTF